MSHVFKYGDRVMYNGLSAKIVSIWYNYLGNETIKIEFDDTSITPNSKEVVSTQLKPYSKDSMWYGEFISPSKKQVGPPKEYCQKCGDKWKQTIHPVLGKKVIWFDCVKCNVKREDYYKE